MTWIVTSICGGCRCGSGVAYNIFSVFCQQFSYGRFCHSHSVTGRLALWWCSHRQSFGQSHMTLVAALNSTHTRVTTPLLMVALHSQMPCSLNSPCQFFFWQSSQWGTLLFISKQLHVHFLVFWKSTHLIRASVWFGIYISSYSYFLSRCEVPCSFIS